MNFVFAAGIPPTVEKIASTLRRWIAAGCILTAAVSAASTSRAQQPQAPSTRLERWHSQPDAADHSLVPFFRDIAAPPEDDSLEAFYDDERMPGEDEQPILLQGPMPEEIRSPRQLFDSPWADDVENFGGEPWSDFGPLLGNQPSDTPEEDAPVDQAASPSTNITIEIQSDATWSDQSAANELIYGEIGDGAFFRRARFGVFGELYETIEYRLEFDFAEPARPRFLDNWVAFTDIPVVNNMIIGHYFEPFSLERYTPNRFITFIERSLADNFTPVRNMGAMTYGHRLNRRFTYAAGVFRSNSDDYGDDVSVEPGYALTLHSTFLPWFEELNEHQVSLLHLGGSFSYRLPGDDPVRYAARPSARLRQTGSPHGIPAFVDTGDIFDVNHTYLVGLESAWVHRRLSVQGELIGAQVSRKTQETPFFYGGYLYTSLFLTDEGRSYSPTSILGRFREGIFQRITPRTNVFDRTRGTGWTGGGACELAVRWSFIDLNDGGVEGGYMEDMTYGLNWYFNPYTKMMFNYVRPVADHPTLGRSTADFYALRFQFEY